MFEVDDAAYRHQRPNGETFGYGHDRFQEFAAGHRLHRIDFPATQGQRTQTIISKGFPTKWHNRRNETPDRVGVGANLQLGMAIYPQPKEVKQVGAIFQ
jgi:hypothetical protein